MLNKIIDLNATNKKLDEVYAGINYISFSIHSKDAKRSLFFIKEAVAILDSFITGHKDHMAQHYVRNALCCLQLAIILIEEKDIGNLKWCLEDANKLLMQFAGPQRGD